MESSCGVDGSVTHLKAIDMPTYEFVCNACQEKFDEYLTIDNRNKPLLNPCPACGAEGSVAKRFDSFPTVGYDMTVKPSSDFKEIMEKVKNSGQVPKRFHENIDAAVERRGGRLGKKSTSDSKSSSHVRKRHE